MDNLVWLARHPEFTGDPLTQVRRVMRRAREAVGRSEEGFARLLQAALPGRTITGPIVQAWESRPPPPPGDVLAVAIGLLGRDLVVELADGTTGGGDLAPLLAVPGIDTERLQSATARSHGVDRRVAEDLAVLTEEYWCLYHRMSPRSLQLVAAAHHDAMRRLVTSSVSTPH